ncbi:two-component response repressor, PtrA [Pseudomonas aeruginosa]|nr:two-component response repressor, PtrA [Pseudomonas aeruginosa]
MRTFTASTLAFLLVLAPTVPAMADSGGDIVFERMQAQAAKARAAHQEKTGEAGRSDEEGQGKLLIASSSTPGSTRDDGGLRSRLHPPPVPWFPVGGFFMPVGGAGRS